MTRARPLLLIVFIPEIPSSCKPPWMSLFRWWPSRRKKALAVIMPHAGYVYSGATAGLTIAQVQVPQTVLIMCPINGLGPALAVSGEDWRMPLGAAPIDRDLRASILQHSGLRRRPGGASVRAFGFEVQDPLSSRWCLKIVPVVVSHIAYNLCETAAHELAAAISKQPQPVLMRFKRHEPLRVASAGDQEGQDGH